MYTQYDLDLDGIGKTQLTTAGQKFDSSVNRSVPIASVDGGLYFDRNTNWFGTNYRQTLEPRAFYLYVPERNQDDIPIFDTSESTFSYSSLWRDNRFTGTDRVGDENKLSLGLTSRWIEETALNVNVSALARRTTSKTAGFNFRVLIRTVRTPLPMCRRMLWNTLTALTATGVQLPTTTGTRTATARVLAAR